LRALRKKNKSGAAFAKIWGVIIPADWDDKGNVMAIAISTRTEEEYRIKMDHNGEKLKAFLHREAEVSGFLRREKNKMVLVIEHFHISKPKYNGVI